VVKGLLEDLVDRGLDLKWRYLVVIDGSKTLSASVERVFGQKWKCSVARFTSGGMGRSICRRTARKTTIGECAMPTPVWLVRGT